MHLIIRPMMASEVKSAQRLIIRTIGGARVYSARARASEKKKYTHQVLLDKINNWPFSVLVAISGDSPVGFCISEIQDEVIWIYWLGVSAEARGRGVADKLLDKLERVAAKSGLHKIWCDSRTSNTPIRLILTRRGFESICTIKDHWYRQDFMLWQKFI